MVRLRVSIRKFSSGLGQGFIVEVTTGGFDDESFSPCCFVGAGRKNCRADGWYEFAFCMPNSTIICAETSYSFACR